MKQSLVALFCAAWLCSAAWADAPPPTRVNPESQGPDRPVPAAGEVPQPVPVAPIQVPTVTGRIAVIVHGESETSPAFDLTVWPDGRVHFAQKPFKGVKLGNMTHLRRVPSWLTQQFFVDLDQAMPLQQYPRPDCPVTLNFGFGEVVGYQGQQTPNLACFALTPHLGLLANDVHAIEQYMEIGYP